MSEVLSKADLAIEPLTEFDAARHLDTPKLAAAYLNAVLGENDPELIDAALLDIERAQAMYGFGATAEIETTAAGAERLGPAFLALRRTFEALGMKLQVAAA